VIVHMIVGQKIAEDIRGERTAPVIGKSRAGQEKVSHCDHEFACQYLRHMAVYPLNRLHYATKPTSALRL
jgi:hypothetical protein